MTIFLTIPLTIVSIVGLVLNIYILIVVLLTKQATSGNNILLLHLGAIDVVLGVIYLVSPIPGYSKTEWLSSGVPCIIHGFFFTLLNPLVLWTICGLNCERYYAIAAPLHYGHIVNTRKICAGLAVGWAISLVLCLPPFLAVAPYSFIPGLGACAPNFGSGAGTLWYSSLYTAFTLLLPATLIICCNFKILMIARYHRHRIASAIFEVTLSAQVTITHQRNPFATVSPPTLPKFRGRNAIDTILQIVGSLLILYVPYYCLILWEATGPVMQEPRSKIHTHIFTAASVLLICSPPVNGFLYGVRSKTLRKTFQNYLRKKQTKSEMIQEIQARTPSTCGSRRPSLTPLGFLTKPNIQRRLSEALLDVSKAVSSPIQRPKMKRIASELTWRPSSTGSINLSPKEEYEKKLQHTTSCNTLKVPNSDTEQVATLADEQLNRSKQKTSPTKAISTSLLFSKFFGTENSEKTSKKSAACNIPDATPKRSPKIMITRAFSEESDKPSSPNSPSKEFITKRHSSSATTLIEKKWKMLRQREEDSDSECGGKSFSHTTKPLLDNHSMMSTRSSESSENSDVSGIMFLSLDNKSSSVEGDAEAHEDQLLLSWPAHKKYNKADDARKQRQNLLKQTLVNMQSHEIVL